MEIRDYANAVFRRSRFVAIVATVAVVIALLIFVLSPRKYQATATVVVPGPSPTTTSLIAGVEQSVSDFQGAIGSDAVAAQVAEATGVSKGTIKAGLSFSRLSSSGVGEVTFTGNDPGLAQRVVEAASDAALLLLVEPDAAALEEQQQQAEDTYAQAQTAMRSFAETTNIFDAREYFRLQTDRLIDLQDQLGVATAQGDTSLASQLQDRITTRRQQVAEQQSDYDRLSAAVQNAEELVTTSQQDAATAQALVASVQSEGKRVNVSEATSVPRFRTLLQILLPTLLIATALAIGLIVLLEIVGMPRRTTSQRVRDVVGGTGPVIAGAADIDGPEEEVEFPLAVDDELEGDEDVDDVEDEDDQDLEDEDDADFEDLEDEDEDDFEDVEDEDEDEESVDEDEHEAAPAQRSADVGSSA